MRRYSWHSVGSLGWPFAMLKYYYIFQTKCTEAIVSNSTRKLLWFEITKNVDCSFRKKLLLHFRHTFVPSEDRTEIVVDV